MMTQPINRFLEYVNMSDELLSLLANALADDYNNTVELVGKECHFDGRDEYLTGIHELWEICVDRLEARHDREWVIENLVCMI